MSKENISLFAERINCDSLLSLVTNSEWSACQKKFLSLIEEDTFVKKNILYNNKERHTGFTTMSVFGAIQYAIKYKSSKIGLMVRSDISYQDIIYLSQHIFGELKQIGDIEFRDLMTMQVNGGRDNDIRLKNRSSIEISKISAAETRGFQTYMSNYDILFVDDHQFYTNGNVNSSIIKKIKNPDEMHGTNMHTLNYANVYCQQLIICADHSEYINMEKLHIYPRYNIEIFDAERFIPT